MYSLKDISDFSGIEYDRLRNWQSRYHFLVPSTAGKYPEEAIIKTVNLATLVGNGWRISKALKLNNSELVSTADSIIESTTSYRFEAVINGLVRTIFEFDEANFIKLYRSARKRMRFGLFVEELLYPFLDRLLLLWRKYRLSLIHQSFAVELLKMLLANEYVDKFTDKSFERVLLYSTKKDELLLYFVMVYLQIRRTNPVLLGTQLDFYKIEPALLSMRVSGVIGIGDQITSKEIERFDMPFFNPDSRLRRKELLDELDAFIQSMKKTS